MALKVLRAGQWMYNIIPFRFFCWSNDFDLTGSCPSICLLVWVELPNLPQSLHKWVAKIVSPLGKVLDTRLKTDYIPSWNPQILVEIDVTKPLLKDVTNNCGFMTRVQTILYKHLPNACFYCGRQGRHSKRRPIKFPKSEGPPLNQRLEPS